MKLITLLMCFITLQCNCENFTDLCYNTKKIKNIDNLMKIYKTAISGTAKNIQKYGYPVEVHEVGTDDGYVLDMQRIPHGPANERSYDALPVLILHGLGSSSAPYVILSNGIAYTLVNEGYDVWLGNFRCSFEDTRHVNYSHWQNKFWNFGLDEYGLSDTPAMIDHILQTTNRTQLTVISLSMSTLTTTALLAFKPEYNTKVSRHVLLAPAVRLNYATANIQYNLLKKVYDIVGLTDIILAIVNRLSFYLAPVVCYSPFGFMHLCQWGIMLTTGYTPGIYGSCIGAILSSVLRGVSLRTLLHYYQIITTQQLIQFDYGLDENLKKYGTEIPPIADVSKITTPTSLIYSANDPLATPLNVALLARDMKTAKVNLLEDTMITHVDFIIAAFDDNIMKRINRVILENIRLP